MTELDVALKKVLLTFMVGTWLSFWNAACLQTRGWKLCRCKGYVSIVQQTERYLTGV